MGKLTTVDKRSHLTLFGEYMAMYLFVWSDVLWPDDVPNSADASSSEAADKQRLSTLMETSQQRLGGVDFRAGLMKVRRALANIPST